jgi:hypothetical protein
MVDIEANGQNMPELSLEANKKLSELYGIYREKLKPLIFIVESFTNKFPIQVLNEIRSVQDHIASCFLNGNADDSICLKEIGKAKGHLQRAIADCYKILIQIYFPDTITSFYKQYKRVNLCLVDDGRFLPELTKLEKIAKEKSLLAKQNEFNSNGEISCTDFEEAVLAYENILSHIENHSQGLANAAQHTERNIWRDWKFALVSGIIGAILSTGVLLIIQNWDAIMQLFI